MKVMVPPVFLYDEITTDGYGKCVIELMTQHGILEKLESSKITFNGYFQTTGIQKQ